MSLSADENPDFSDVELLQHISVDVRRLDKLLGEIIKVGDCRGGESPTVFCFFLSVFNYLLRYLGGFFFFNYQKNIFNY